MNGHSQHGDRPEAEDAGHGLRCASFRRRLKHLERKGPLADDVSRSIEELRTHAEACQRCHVRYGGRLNALAALRGLDQRRIPQGLLDDLYESVRVQIPYAPPGGGMTLAFLDAPRALKRWRTVALAASFVLALGTGLFASGGLSLSDGAATGPGPRSLPDPRERMLEAYDPSANQPARLRSQPAPRKPRGRSDFYAHPEAQPVEFGRNWR